MEWIVALIVLGCFGVGGYYQYYTDTVDAPAEQLAEAVLKQNNIDTDFSADKKKSKEIDKKD
jgi:hypothetical protein